MSLTIKQNIVAVNHWIGRFGHDIKGIVIHSMAGTYSGSISWFNNPNSGASAHYNIRSDGEITMTVFEKNAAWHAGNVSVRKEKAPEIIRNNWGINPNFFTIGIELEDNNERGKRVYPELQYDACVELVADICERYDIAPSRGTVVMHKETDPVNKFDPWGHWDQDKFVKDVSKTLHGDDIGTPEEFYVYEAEIAVDSWVDVLNVRSKPTTKAPLSGSEKLYKGQSFRVTGFVKGQRVKYGTINTQFWWVSEFGNYIWSGGTTLIPTLDNYPESLSKKLKKKEPEMEELRQLVADLSVREGELVNELKAFEDKAQELEGVRSAIKDAEQALEEAQEDVVEETPVEEVEAVETVAPDAEEVEEVEETEEVVEETPQEPLSKVDEIKKKYNL